MGGDQSASPELGMSITPLITQNHLNPTPSQPRAAFPQRFSTRPHTKMLGRCRDGAGWEPIKGHLGRDPRWSHQSVSLSAREVFPTAFAPPSSGRGCRGAVGSRPLSLFLFGARRWRRAAEPGSPSGRKVCKARGKRSGRKGGKKGREGSGAGGKRVRTCMVTTPSSSAASFLICAATTCASSRMANSASAAPSPHSSARHTRPSGPRPRAAEAAVEKEVVKEVVKEAASSRRPPPRAMLPRRGAA